MDTIVTSRNVFLIETPHQLVNATEARHHLDISDAHLVIVASKEYEENVYPPILEATGWNAVQYLTLGTARKNAFVRCIKFHKSERVRSYFHKYELAILRSRLDALAHSIGHVKKVFLGNYWVNYMRHFGNVVRCDRLYVLDDGTQTLQINEWRKNEFRREQGSIFKRLKLLFLKMLIGMKEAHPTNVVFFTSYDLITKPEDEVVKHSYDYIRTVAAAVPSSEEVFFLGSELSEEGLSLEQYVSCFRKVLAYFDRQKVIYVKHPRENVKQLSYIRDVFGLEVRGFSIPIEYQLALSPTKPKVLASFCSSALDNCRIIFGEELKIKSFFIEPEAFEYNPDLIREIYSYYETKAGPAFEVVKV